MMTPIEIEFQKMALEDIKLENSKEGGLLFPVLRAVRMPDKPILRALRIKSTRPPHFACYACLAREATMRRYNGNFFTVDDVELEAEGLVEVQYVRLPAIIKANEVLDIEGEVIGIEVIVEVDLEALEKFFNETDAIYVHHKNDLKVDRHL